MTEGFVGSAIIALIHANVVIAVAGAGVTITASWVVGHPFAPLPVAVGFAAVMLAYTINRFTDRVADHHNVPGRAAFVSRHGRLLVSVAAVAYGGVVVITAFRSPRLLPVLLLPPVLAIGYAVPWVRRFPFVKNAVVGACWAAIPLGVGVYYGHIGTDIILVAALIGVLLTIAAMIFDIKDVDGDRHVGTRTIPTRIGPARTRLVALVSLLGLLPAVVVAVLVVSPRFAVFGVYVAYLLLAVPFAGSERGPLYYGGVIDGEHIVVAAAVVAWVLIG